MRQLRRSAAEGRLARRHPVLHERGSGPDGRGMNPSPSQRGALVVAQAVAADAAALRVPLVGKARSLFAIERAAELAGQVGITKLDRRLPVYAASWANWYLGFATRPGQIQVAHPGRQLLAPAIAASQLQMLAKWPGFADGAHALDVRLVLHRDGHQLIDQLTHEHAVHALGGDEFAQHSLAAHFAYGPTLGPFAGVRLLAPRAPLASRHYLSARDWHTAGGCDLCHLNV